jgi:hypothetical protein
VVFPCFFLSCKANARVKLAKTGHGPHSSTLVCICVVRILLFVLFYVLFVYKCVLPPGDNPTSVNNISYRIVSYHIYRIVSYIIYLIYIYHIVSYHIILFIISYRISYHISYRIIYIISYQLFFSCFTFRSATSALRGYINRRICPSLQRQGVYWCGGPALSFLIPT